MQIFRNSIFSLTSPMPRASVASVRKSIRLGENGFNSHVLVGDSTAEGMQLDFSCRFLKVSFLDRRSVATLNSRKKVYVHHKSWTKPCRTQMTHWCTGKGRVNKWNPFTSTGSNLPAHPPSKATTRLAADHPCHQVEHPSSAEVFVCENHEKIEPKRFNRKTKTKIDDEWMIQIWFACILLILLGVAWLELSGMLGMVSTSSLTQVDLRTMNSMFLSGPVKSSTIIMWFLEFFHTKRSLKNQFPTYFLQRWRGFGNDPLLGKQLGSLVSFSPRHRNLKSHPKREREKTLSKHLLLHKLCQWLAQSEMFWHRVISTIPQAPFLWKRSWIKLASEGWTNLCWLHLQWKHRWLPLISALRGNSTKTTKTTKHCHHHAVPGTL